MRGHQDIGDDKAPVRHYYRSGKSTNTQALRPRVNYYCLRGRGSSKRPQSFSLKFHSPQRSLLRPCNSTVAPLLASSKATRLPKSSVAPAIRTVVSAGFLIIFPSAGSVAFLRFEVNPKAWLAG